MIKESNPLTSSDFLRMISLYPKTLPIAGSMMEFLGMYNSSNKIISNYLIQTQKKLIESMGGKFPLETNTSQLCVFKKDGKSKLIIDPNLIFLSILTLYGINIDHDEMRNVNFKFYMMENEQDYEEYKKRIKRLLVKSRNEILDSLNEPFFVSFANDKRKVMYEATENLKWYNKNIDTILQTFINYELDYELLFEHVHMFRFLGIMCNLGCSTELLSLDNWSDEKSKDLGAFLVNFQTFLEYYNNHVPEDLQYNLVIQSEDNPKDERELNEIINQKLENIPEDERINIGYHDPKELFKNILIDYGNEIEKKEKEERKAKRKEEFRELMLSWEIVPDVESLSNGLKVVGSRRSKKSDAEIRQIELKREETLKRKLDLFSSLEYITVLKGTNHFDGYVGYLFPNGKVILEKFYKSTKHGTMPVINEAIYVMNYKTFEDLSLCSKSELRDFIESGYYDDLKVINHSKNFEANVVAAISGNDYTDEILEYLEELVNDASQVIKKPTRN